VSEHGDLIRLILIGNRFVDQPKRNTDSRCEDISSERGDLALIDNDSNVFKFSDLFNKNGEIYDDTLRASPDHGDVLVRDEHGCLVSVFDCDAVSIIQSEYRPLTMM